MNKIKNRLPKVAKFFIAATMVFFIAASFVSSPLQAAENGADNFESAIPCNENLAIEVVKNHGKTQDCLAAAQLQFPGRIVSYSVTSAPYCTSPIRGCTYTVTVSLTLPCPNPPYCLAGPDVLVATATVNCQFAMTDIVCY